MPPIPHYPQPGPITLEGWGMVMAGLTILVCIVLLAYAWFPPED